MVESTNKIENYLNFIKAKGKSLSEINPGSNEFALNIDDSLEAISLLKEAHVAILGGDILYAENGEKLTYIYENWYCEKSESENQIEYINRSHDTAINYIEKLKERRRNNIYVVIVI